MNHIVVPTDFSKNAENALRYAIHLANQFESNIHLIHVYEIHSRAGMLMNIRDFIREDAEKNLSHLVKKVKNSLTYGVTLESKAIQGSTTEIIDAYAKKVEAGLIVMGTQGASGLQEVFIGSNTEGLLKKTSLPVLAIPNDYQYQPIKKITFSIDSEIISNSDVLDPLLKIATKSQSLIHILHIEKVKTVADIDAGIDIYLSDVPHQYHLINDENINHGINKFVEDIQADMLCMIRRKRSFLGKLFHKSITRKEAFHTTVPLLVLHDDK